MLPPDFVAAQRSEPGDDVAESQGPNLGNKACQSQRQSATVSSGRTQAAFASHEGCAIGRSEATFQEYRSRGCRRARKLSWHCAWWPLWQPVAVPSSLKSFMWTSRFRSRPPTPANTNKSVGRVGGVYSPGPALSLPLLACPISASHDGSRFALDRFEVGNSPPVDRLKPLGSDPALPYAQPVHIRLMGGLEWTSVNHFSYLSLLLCWPVVHLNPRRSRSCQNRPMTNSATSRFRRRSVSLTVSGQCPAPQTGPRCQVVNRAACPAPSWMAGIPPQPTRRRSVRSACPFRGGRAKTAQVPAFLVAGATDPARKLGASALGLTPTLAYGCPHPSSGGISC